MINTFACITAMRSEWFADLVVVQSCCFPVGSTLGRRWDTTEQPMIERAQPLPRRSLLGETWWTEVAGRWWILPECTCPDIVLTVYLKGKQTFDAKAANVFG